MNIKRRSLLAIALLLGLNASPSRAQETVIAVIVFQQDQLFRAFRIGMETAAPEAGVILLQANAESKRRVRRTHWKDGI